MKKILATLIILFSFSAHSEEKNLEILSSIEPVRGLVSAITGENNVGLIVTGSASPHGYDLKPSDAKKISHAEIIFLIDENFESFLKKPLGNISKNIAVVNLTDEAKIDLLPLRQGGLWEKHEHHEEAEEHHDEHKHEEHAHESGKDFHIWLDTNNARKMLKTITEKLSEKYPEKAAIYKNNHANYLKKLDELDKNITSKIKNINGNYYVFHDAYQYFEKQFGISASGSITIDPENPVSAKRVSELREKINSSNIKCVFAEPQFEPKIIDTIIAGTAAKKGTLDPEGKNIANKNNSYIELLTKIAGNLEECLK
jgi:zinc transport system substrate-binding protein